MDLNQDGIFDPVTEEFRNGAGGTLSVVLESTKSYNIAIGYHEAGGNERISVTVKGPAGSSITYGTRPRARRLSGEP